MTSRARLIHQLIIYSTILFIASCGNQSTAPNDGSIEITPASSPFTVGTTNACFGVNSGADLFTEYTIVIKDLYGSPQGNTDFNFQIDFAQNSWTGIEVIRVYDDQGLGDDDGVAEAGEEISLVGSPVSYDTTTLSDGTRKIIVQRELTNGCTYAGNVIVTSGSVVQFSSFANVE